MFVQRYKIGVLEHRNQEVEEYGRPYEFTDVMLSVLGG